MSTEAPSSPIEWFLEPWLTGASGFARAGRIGAVTLSLTTLILPGMMLYFGLDGWWWDTTLSVCLVTPLGIILFDALAEIGGRAVSRPIRGLPRVLVLVVGLLAGNFAAYVVILLFRMTPDRTVHLVLSDFRRNLGILVPAIAVVVTIGTMLFHRAEAYRLESARAVASYAVLKGQMQPHFLFNALNALKELIADDPELARAFAQRLADLYRLILKVSTDATTPLTDELAIVGHYLEVERVRYGDRLSYRIEASDELGSAHVPTLLVQTLVENAIKHGIGRSRAGGEVHITAERIAEGSVAIEVSNTGAPFDPAAPGDPSGPPKTGLANTRERLALMYGGASELTITSDPVRGTCVRVVVSGKKPG